MNFEFFFTFLQHDDTDEKWKQNAMRMNVQKQHKLEPMERKSKW